MEHALRAHGSDPESGAFMVSQIKRLVPRRLREFRYEAAYTCRRYLWLAANLGGDLECPFCGWRFRRFLDGGPRSPLFSQLRVIPGGLRPNVGCPRCDSNDRERLVYLYLKNKTDVFSRPLRLLHVAPEPCLRKVFEAHPSIRYTTAEIEAQRVSLRMDVTSIPVLDAVFDVILCNHVLEHVPDDRTAMAELCRVLRPGGLAILQTPIAPDLPETREDASVRSPEARLRFFGQTDHVRVYGQDYADRLRSSGFEVAVCDYQAELQDASRYALLKDEKLFICRRPR